MFLVDSHCHLDGLDYQSLHKNVDDVLAKAAARDVKFCLAVATTLPGYRTMRELVGIRDNVVSLRPGEPPTSGAISSQTSPGSAPQPAPYPVEYERLFAMF